MKGIAVLLGAFFGMVLGIVIGYFVVPMVMPKPEPEQQTGMLETPVAACYAEVAAANPHWG